MVKAQQSKHDCDGVIFTFVWLHFRSPFTFCNQSKQIFFCLCMAFNFCSLFFTADGDYDQIWTRHCEDEASLGQYACAMQHLAQEHWSTDHPDDRIKWSHQTCMKYFLDGGLAQTLQKDRRRRDFQHKVSTSKPSVLCNSKNGLHGNGVSAKTASEDALERISTQYNTM